MIGLPVEHFGGSKGFDFFKSKYATAIGIWAMDSLQIIALDLCLNMRCDTLSADPEIVLAASPHPIWKSGPGR